MIRSTARAVTATRFHHTSTCRTGHDADADADDDDDDDDGDEDDVSRRISVTGIVPCAGHISESPPGSADDGHDSDTRHCTVRQNRIE